MPTDLVAGVDLGGTSLLAVVATETGEILGSAQSDTPRAPGDPGPIVAEIARAVRKAARKAGADVSDLRGLGVGVPGTVDPATGFVAKAVNLGWRDVHLTDLLGAEVGLPTYAAGDVQVAITGEAAFGAARDVRAAVGVWIGTGLGGGLLIDGELYRGHAGAAGEIGHMVILEGGPACGCGRHGCAEALSSRTAIERDIRAAIAAGRESRVLEIMREKGKERVTAGVLRKALEAGDPVVREVVAGAQGHLGVFVANLINILDPELVVVGGGLVEKLGEDFVAPVRDRALAEAFPRPGAPPRILPSALGDDAGALGATVIARRRLAPAPAGRARAARR